MSGPDDADRSTARDPNAGHPLEMERGPWWSGRRYRLRRRAARPGEGQPLWVRVGLRSRLPAGVALSLAAGVCALIGAAALLVLALTPEAVR